MIEKGDLCKHFKGKTLEEKNIYRILETGVSYTGCFSTQEIQDLVIYENIFQGKIFAREMSTLVEELPYEKQQLYGQKYRVEKLTDEEKIQVEELIKIKRR